MVCSLIMVHVQLPTWWVSTGKVTYVEWTHWNSLPLDLFIPKEDSATYPTARGRSRPRNSLFKGRQTLVVIQEMIASGSLPGWCFPVRSSTRDFVEQLFIELRVYPSSCTEHENYMNHVDSRCPRLSNTRVQTIK